ncbi:MAG: hypothetical protein Q9219_006768 [cf. Caloplaca sp. 3 TL-2023]
MLPVWDNSDYDPSEAEPALAMLVEQPERLQHARHRFSESPPADISLRPRGIRSMSTRSRVTTPPTPATPPGEDEFKSAAQFALECGASTPANQFRVQQAEEEKRVFEAEDDGKLDLPCGTIYTRYTYIHEPGIFGVGERWLHEEPLDSTFATTPHPEIFKNPFAGLFERTETPNNQRREPLSTKQRAEIARERDAPRSFYHFQWQLAKERDRIHGELVVGEAAASASLDINTQAYQNMKSLWEERRLWDTKWANGDAPSNTRQAIILSTYYDQIPITVPANYGLEYRSVNSQDSRKQRASEHPDVVSTGLQAPIPTSLRKDAPFIAESEVQEPQQSAAEQSTRSNVVVTLKPPAWKPPDLSRPSRTLPPDKPRRGRPEKRAEDQALDHQEIKQGSCKSHSSRCPSQQADIASRKQHKDLNTAPSRERPKTTGHDEAKSVTGEGTLTKAASAKPQGIVKEKRLRTRKKKARE